MNLKESIKIVNANLIFVPLLALSSIFIFPSYFMFLVILMFVLDPIAYGKLVGETIDLPKTTWCSLFNVHWKNYLVVGIITGSPLIIMSFFYDDMNYIQKTTIKNLLGFIISCLTIYIWPLVFINKEIKPPIFQGINILLKNIRISTPLILITFFMFALKFLVELSLIKLMPLTSFKVFLIFIAPRTINVYLEFIILTSATMFIKEHANKLINQQELNE